MSDITMQELLDALRPFAFLNSPNNFGDADDGGVTECLVADADVQRARALIAPPTQEKPRHE